MHQLAATSVDGPLFSLARRSVFPNRVRLFLLVLLVMRPAYCFKFTQDGFSLSVSSNSLQCNVPPSSQVMSTVTAWPVGLSKGRSSFAGSVLDGSSIWLVPSDAHQVVRVTTANSSMIVYNEWPPEIAAANPKKFCGGTFDGSFIWLIPDSASALVRIDPVSGRMTTFDGWPIGFVKGIYAFRGGIFDGSFLWLVPYDANQVIRVDPKTGNMTGYIFPSLLGRENAFIGGVFDGTSIWLVPSEASKVIRIDTISGNMSSHNLPVGFDGNDREFSSAVFDGSFVWLVPYEANGLIRIDIATSAMTGYSNWPGVKCIGGVFDGTSVWLIPQSKSDAILRLNTSTRETTEYRNWPLLTNPSLTVDFSGATFDGSSIWLIPARNDDLIKLSVNCSEPSVSQTLEPPQSSSWINTTLSVQTPPSNPAALPAIAVTSTSSTLGAAVSSGGSGTDLQSLFVVGRFRCNGTFLKRLSDEGGNATLVPLQIGSQPLSGLLGMLIIESGLLFLHAILALVAFRFLRLGSFADGARKVAFPSASIAVCFALHQGTFVEVLQIWSGEVPSTVAEMVASIGLFIVVMGPSLACIAWPLAGLKERFIRYRHVFASSPMLLRVFVLPQGYWTGDQPLSPMMRSGFGGFVTKPFCLFGLVSIIRSFTVAAVSVLGKYQTCAVQTWVQVAVILSTTALFLLLRPHNTRLTLVISTLSSLLTATLTILNQYPGVDEVIEKLTIASTSLTIIGTVLSLIVKVLAFRWRLQETEFLKSTSSNSADNSADGDVALQDPPPFFTPLHSRESVCQSDSSSFMPPPYKLALDSPLLLVPQSSTSPESLRSPVPRSFSSDSL